MWKIRLNDHIVKKLHKHRSNKAVLDGYGNAALELARSIDPGRLGDRKHGRLRHLYGYRITKSCRLLYHVDRDKGEIVMVDLDDHKNIYGRD